MSKNGSMSKNAFFFKNFVFSGGVKISHFFWRVKILQLFAFSRFRPRFPFFSCFRPRFPIFFVFSTNFCIFFHFFLKNFDFFSKIFIFFVKSCVFFIDFVKNNPKTRGVGGRGSGDPIGGVPPLPMEPGDPPKP